MYHIIKVKNVLLEIKIFFLTLRFTIIYVYEYQCKYRNIQKFFEEIGFVEEKTNKLIEI